MKKRLLITAVAVLLLGLAAVPAQAKPAADLPRLTGGGVTQNFNSAGLPFGPPYYHTVGGFTAGATAAGIAGAHPYFLTALTSFAAKGNVQAMTVDAFTGAKIGSIHAKVVCIANYGPANGVHAFDFNATAAAAYGSNDVWEIRFLVSKADNPAFVGLYGSLMVQDNGSVDFADESFANYTSAACGNVTFFDLEPHLQGNIAFHG